MNVLALAAGFTQFCGVASLLTAALFVCVLFAYPLVHMIAGRYMAGGVTLYPAIAALLILVGAMMPGLRYVEWPDPSEAIPALLTMVLLPLSVSSTEGMVSGVVAWVLLKAATGRGGQVHGPLLRVRRGPVRGAPRVAPVTPPEVL